MGNSARHLLVFSSMASIEFTDGSRFDPASGEIRRHGVVARLEPQPAEVLALLVARPGQLVGHDEIRRVVWSDGTHVNFQDGLHYAIRRIRAAFDDSARNPWLIETIPRRGYRLRASALMPRKPPSATTSRGAATRPAWLALAGVATALLVVVAATLLERHPNNHHAVALAVARTVHDWLF